MGGSATAIDEVVGFLGELEPQRLSGLKQRFPEQADVLFAPGVQMGATPSAVEAKAVACLEALQSVSKQVASKGPQLRAKLEKANRISLAAQIAALVSTASIVVQLAATNNVVKVASGIVALIGSALAAVAQYFAKPSVGGNDSLVENYLKLTDAWSDADQLLRDFEGWKATGFAPDQEDGLIAKANAAIKEIRGLIAKI